MSLSVCVSVCLTVYRRTDDSDFLPEHMAACDRYSDSDNITDTQSRHLSLGAFTLRPSLFALNSGQGTFLF